MNLSLHPSVQKFIEEKVQAGQYATPGDVIHTAIARLQSDEESDQEGLDEEDLAAVEEGLAQANRGEGRPWEEVREELRKKYLPQVNSTPDRYRVIITPRAAANLEGIHRFIEKDSAQNAASVAMAIIDAIDSLESLPHRYPIYQGRRQPSETVRRMPVPPFLIYYRVNDSNRAVDIVTLLHGKRRQPRRFK